MSSDPQPLFDPADALRQFILSEQAFGVEDLPRAECPVAEASEAQQPLSIESVGEEIRACEGCSLHGNRTSAVPGEGLSASRLMFVGGAPGADEDLAGRPFVGQAGDLLTKMIGAMGLRREDVFIAYALNCQPPGNRDPEPDELASCSGHLQSQIDLVRPDVICALGEVATRALLGAGASVSSSRGRAHCLDARSTQLVCTHHPGDLLRYPEKKREAWGDLKVVISLLSEA